MGRVQDSAAKFASLESFESVNQCVAQTGNYSENRSVGHNSDLSKSIGFIGWKLMTASRVMTPKRLAVVCVPYRW